MVSAKLTLACATSYVTKHMPTVPNPKSCFLLLYQHSLTLMKRLCRKNGLSRWPSKRTRPTIATCDPKSPTEPPCADPSSAESTRHSAHEDVPAARQSLFTAAPAQQSNVATMPAHSPVLHHFFHADFNAALLQDTNSLNTDQIQLPCMGMTNLDRVWEDWCGQS